MPAASSARSPGTGSGDAAVLTGNSTACGAAALVSSRASRLPALSLTQNSMPGLIQGQAVHLAARRGDRVAVINVPVRGRDHPADLIRVVFGEPEAALVVHRQVVGPAAGVGIAGNIAADGHGKFSELGRKRRAWGAPGRGGCSARRAAAPGRRTENERCRHGQQAQAHPAHASRTTHYLLPLRAFCNSFVSSTVPPNSPAR